MPLLGTVEKAQTIFAPQGYTKRIRFIPLPDFKRKGMLMNDLHFWIGSAAIPKFLLTEVDAYFAYL